MLHMVPVTPSLPATPTPIGEQIAATFRVWMRTLRTSWLLALLPGLVALLPTTLIPMPGNLFDPAAFDPLFDWIHSPLTWAMLVAVVLAQVYFLAALAYRLGHVGRGSDPGLAGSLMVAARRLPAALGGSLLYAALLLTSLLPAIALTIPLFLDDVALPLRALSGFGALLLLAPPTWFSLAGAAYLFAIMLEGHGPVGGMSRSLALMRGHWWPASAVVGVALLVYMGLGSAIGSAIMTGVLSVLLALRGADSLFDLGWLVATQWAMAPFSAVLQLQLIAAVLVVFNDLVLRRSSPSAG